MDRPGIVISALRWSDWLKLAAALTLAIFLAVTLVHVGIRATGFDGYVAYAADVYVIPEVIMNAGYAALMTFLMVVGGAAALRLFFAALQLVRRLTS